MFGFLKKPVAENKQDEADIARQAADIGNHIGALEQRLASNARDGEAQKQLMVAYNRALSLFAKSPAHRQEMDALFVKMDELRNIMRKSV